ncbi:MAG: hypothetical protein ACRCVN_02685 [Spirochaetia bacterium]
MGVEIADLEKLETQPVLKTLNKLWEQFSLFRNSCLKFDGAEELLTSLVLVFNKNTIPSPMQPNDKTFESFFSTFTSMMQHSNENMSNLDMVIIKKIWEKPLNATIFAEVINAFNPGIEIPTPLISLFKMHLEDAKNSQYDPFLKIFFLAYVINGILEILKAKDIPSIQRIITVKINHDYSMSDKPVLYHLHLIQPKIKMNEESIISYAQSLTNVYQLGNIVLSHAIALHKELIQEIEKSYILMRIYKDPAVFINIFNRPTITIFQMMESFNWKRDKVARTLNSLVKEGYFTIKKSSREKVYINMFFLQILNRIRNNSQIHAILFNFL